MTDRERQLTELLEKIVNRAHRPEKFGSTDHYVQKVPAPLIEQARQLLGMPK